MSSTFIPKKLRHENVGYWGDLRLISAELKRLPKCRIAKIECLAEKGEYRVEKSEF